MRDSNSRRRGLAFGLAALVALCFAVVPAGADHHEKSVMKGDKPMIVKIHADWCGTCTRLETTFKELEQQIGSDARIVVLDVTDKAAVARSAAEADRLGIRDFFDSYKSKTGTVGVIDANGKTVSVLKGEMDPSKYVAAVQKANGQGAS
jgi:thiol-disulfide isomerase/thioredoxin